MGVAPGTAELKATIARMEARLDDDPHANDLMQSYRDLCTRFAEDLSDPRDVLLSRAAALMMIRYALEGESGR